MLSANNLQARIAQWLSRMSRRCLSTVVANAITMKQKMTPGVYPILVTPFYPDESLDLPSFQRTIRFMKQLDHVQGITICGVLGEGDKLLETERAFLVTTARQELNQRDHHRQQTPSSSSSSSPYSCHDQKHLCVGISHPSTAGIVAQCQMVHELGADSVLVAPTRAHQSTGTIVDSYYSIQQACPDTLGIVIQDYPAHTGVHLDINTLVELSNLRAVTAIKLESLPTVERLLALTNHPEWRTGQTAILTGLGALYAGYDIAQQQHEQRSEAWSGFMTGFALPEVLGLLFEYAHAKRDNQRAFEIYQTYLPLMVLEQYGGLPLRKELCKQRGWITDTHCRQPASGRSGNALKDSLTFTLNHTFPKGIDLIHPIHKGVLLEHV